MVPAQTTASWSRTVMLRAGASTTQLWLRAAHRDTPPLRHAARAAYHRHAARLPWPTHRVLQGHQAFSVLPGAAVYTALTEHGDTSAEAARAVHRALTVMAKPRARLFQQLTTTEPGRRLFMTAAAAASPRLFPDPGWHAHWRDRSPERVSFDMTRCYDLDMLRLLDATAIAPAYCAVDDTLYSHLHPQIRWHRNGTLATGSTHCDFCFTHDTAATG